MSVLERPADQAVPLNDRPVVPEVHNEENTVPQGMERVARIKEEPHDNTAPAEQQPVLLPRANGEPLPTVQIRVKEEGPRVRKHIL